VAILENSFGTRSAGCNKPQHILMQYTCRRLWDGGMFNGQPSLSNQTDVFTNASMIHG